MYLTLVLYNACSLLYLFSSAVHNVQAESVGSFLLSPRQDDSATNKDDISAKKTGVVKFGIVVEDEEDHMIR